MRNPYRGVSVWPTEEGIEFTITLYRDSKRHNFEHKNYLISVEEKPLSSQAKVKAIAQCKLDLSLFVDREATESSVPMTTEVFKIPLTTTSRKVTDGEVSLSITSQFIKEGSAMDEDMISIASLLSMQAVQEGALEEEETRRRKEAAMDVANLDDFDDIKQFSSDLTHEITEITNQIGQLAAFSFDPEVDLIPTTKPTLPAGSHETDLKSSVKQMTVDIETARIEDESKGDQDDHEMNVMPLEHQTSEHPLSRDDGDDSKAMERRKEDDDQQGQNGVVDHEEEEEEDFSNPLEKVKRKEKKQEGLVDEEEEKSRLLLRRSIKCFSGSKEEDPNPDDHGLLSTNTCLSTNTPTTTTILSRDFANNQLCFSQRLSTLFEFLFVYVSFC